MGAAHEATPPPPRATARKPQSLEDIRREARENWLRIRENRMQGREVAPVNHKERSRDDDLSR
jgi:hypothetical protein